jgi:hypothetical protein
MSYWETPSSIEAADKRVGQKAIHPFTHVTSDSNRSVKRLPNDRETSDKNETVKQARSGDALFWL